MRYFDLYTYILKVISENPIDDLDDLLQALLSDKKTINTVEVVEILQNLMTDGLVNGEVKKTKMGNIYIINQVTTAGHQFLAETQNSEFRQKLIRLIKDQGIPLTPTNVIKFVMNLIF
ncbi:hypothetical protein K1728_01800 [Weissella confusa]|uniref:hypothetical protein n=1 Tax=Weissella confusa TaxID=1583 RepID=UPI001C6F82BA|nr:hypothetical protein [Weissella confusa]QYU58171.1 hypothetical protein K1728_01800 [Weissella confusa]